ncbi:MAG: excinuclease ABC subunit UvrA [Paludibacteraceae bacterium]|nr:excinuclease ABC subunit UvrA [Paludibacteraceae bacterium]MBR2451494.1 excinuclease ABC subunit UvrA [Paludibacteraceae bacterium]
MTNKGNDILITGARVHNLKNVDVRIPRDKLVVITGLSGSGKSSLAFDTIFAEGQRRYMETFSSYARGYIGTMQRPDVDKITGLSPVISIDQKTTSRNPRSTVGTVTEVYDYLRLLFARAADAYSYASGEKMVQYTDDQIIDLILKDYTGQKVLVLAPMVNNRKGHYKELFETIRRKGYLHVRVDGEVMEITPGMKLDRYKNHTIEVVVDRLKLKSESEEDLKRLRATVDKAMTQGDGVMAISIANSQLPIRYFSRHLMCPTTGMSYAEPAPHTFSFNSPQGWCPTCRGLGRIKDGLRTPDAGNPDLTNILRDDENWYTRMLEYVQQPEDEKEEKEETWCECPTCKGQRLSREALSFRIADKNIAELSAMDITDLRAWLMNVPARLTNKQRAIAEPIIKEIISRLGFMLSVGLSYLSLSRSSDSLSGGENQRIRLATQVGSKLVNVLYILDEPSIGLHQRDNQRLIDSLKQLRDMGNSVIVVEHDEDMMRQADYIIDIGPKAGRLGGHIVFSGTPAELLKADTLTAKYLRGELSATLNNTTQSYTTLHNSTPTLVLRGCRGNNLKGVDVSFPLGQMIAVTGVSGSGKSTLVNQTLYPILSQHFYRSLQTPLAYDSIEGIEYIDKVIGVDQSPIGRTPRSNPATYTGVFTDIRNLFAQLPESKIRSWKAGRFSFNNSGGRCEECSGNGYKTIQMHFLPNVYVPCEVCGGQRYNRETLEARFKGKSIADVLDMTINQAVEFFESQPNILKKIKTLQDVGLGYIKLGQSSTTLSGGESQRVKLATELARPSTGKTLYILDEPTTGLHFEDVRVLMGVLRQLVDKGNTVIIIEHNPDVIRSCDYLIDMGPDGGRDGGTVVATGTVEEIRENKNSITGRYI